MKKRNSQKKKFYTVCGSSPAEVRIPGRIAQSIQQGCVWGTVKRRAAFRNGWSTKKKQIATPEFRIWSPTTLLGQALTSLTTVDRTGNGAFWQIWPQPKYLVSQATTPFRRPSPRQKSFHQIGCNWPREAIRTKKIF